MAEYKEQENYKVFPYKDHTDRLKRYDYNDRLFAGSHFDAFAIKIDNLAYGREYAKLKYIVANFPGLVSKVIADMLFSEPIGVAGRKKEDDTSFLKEVIFENKLEIQLYESALSNSRRGDAVFKIRIGKRDELDEKETLIIEDINPYCYFPHLNHYNLRQTASVHELAWVVDIGGKPYLRQELDYLDYIENHLFALEGSKGDYKILGEVDLSLITDEAIEARIDKKIKRHLIVHVPNWKDGSTFFGYDDYRDLYSIFFAINNRISKIDNILDKHSDPILALPEGVLDEKGQVRREAFQMFEIPNSVGNESAAKPEYIVWNASLENAFKEIDQLVDFLYMFSETSPDVFGMGDGEISGRALKLKLLRTVAKAARKKVYYDHAIREVLYTAQLLAQAWKIDVNGVKVNAPFIPEIEWNDGLPHDEFEQAQIEEMRKSAGNTSVKDSIIRLDNVDEKTAEEKAAEIESQGKVSLPTTTPNQPASALEAFNQLS